MINKLLASGLCFTCLIFSTSIFAGTQTISPSQSNLNVSSGDTIEFIIEYSASSPRDTTGVGVQLYYDSSKLTFTGTSDVFAKGQAGGISDADDITNRDGDTATDKKIPAAWFDIGNDWPGAANPGDIALYKVKFTVNAGFTSDTTINFTGDASGGHVFASTPVKVATLAKAIPTLNQWGIILLSIMLVLLTWLKAGRKNKPTTPSTVNNNF